MLNKLFILSIFTPLIFALPKSEVEAGRAFYTKNERVIEAKVLDKEAFILKHYFAKYNSPLESHSQDFIDASKIYNVDWRLVPAIAGVESTFGKNIPGGYNGWGWGVYGKNALYFKSWREGIFTVTEGLRKNYIDKGLTTPHQMNRVYAASPTWGWKVSYFINDLTKFSQNFPNHGELITYSNIEVKTYGASARLNRQPFNKNYSDIELAGR